MLRETRGRLLVAAFAVILLSAPTAGYAQVEEGDRERALRGALRGGVIGRVRTHKGWTLQGHAAAL